MLFYLFLCRSILFSHDSPAILPPEHLHQVQGEVRGCTCRSKYSVGQCSKSWTSGRCSWGSWISSDTIVQEETLPRQYSNFRCQTDQRKSAVCGGTAQVITNVFIEVYSLLYYKIRFYWCLSVIDSKYYCIFHDLQVSVTIASSTWRWPCCHSMDGKNFYILGYSRSRGLQRYAKCLWSKDENSSSYYLRQVNKILTYLLIYLSVIVL